MRRRRSGHTGMIVFLLVLMACTALLAFKGPEIAGKLGISFVNMEGSTAVTRIRNFLNLNPEEVTALRSMEVASEDPGHQEYYFSLLGSTERRIYRQMLSGVRSFKEKFYLTTSDEELITKVFNAVTRDHPEIYWVHNTMNVYTTTYGGADYCEFSPGYSFNAEQAAQIDQAIEQCYADMIATIPGNATDYDKVTAAYTWIIDHTEYEFNDCDQNIAGVFWKGHAVCAGYAGALQFFLERLNIPCIYVEGDTRGSTEGHAWCIVLLNNQYYIVDPTNADQPEFLEGDFAQLAEHKTTIMDYLCPFPEEYGAVYTPNSRFPVPVCMAHDLNFYVLNQACFDNYNWQSVYDLSRLRIDHNAAVIRFKFSSKEAFDQAYSEWVNGDGAGETAQYYMRSHGLTNVSYHCGAIENLRTIYLIF